MNREQRRKKEKEYAKDKEAQLCPLCNKKSLFVAFPTEKPHICSITCLLCNGVVVEEKAIPYTYCKLAEG